MNYETEELELKKGREKLTLEEVKSLEQTLKRIKWEYKIVDSNYVMIAKYHVKNIEDMYALNAEWLSRY